VDNRKGAAGIVAHGQDRRLPQLELGHGPTLVPLGAPGAERRKLSSIRQSCDDNGFAGAPQIGVQARRLVRDQGVTSKRDIELRQRLRVVEQIVCLVHDDAVGIA
jgi:hypothetical protein